MAYRFLVFHTMQLCYNSKGEEIMEQIGFKIKQKQELERNASLMARDFILRVEMASPENT